MVFSRWVEEQRRLCDTLGLSTEAWLELLEGAAERRAGLMAAVVGASVAAGLGMKPAAGVDPEALLTLARQLLGAPHSQLSHPVLAAAAQNGAPTAGRGAARLKARRARPEPVEAPTRAQEQPAESDARPTPDAPGAER